MTSMAKSSGSGVARRIEAGTTILNAGQRIDLRPIQERFEAFRRVHAAYVAANVKVAKAEHDLEVVEAEIGTRDATQDECVRNIVGCLISDRQPMRQPFGKFLAISPVQLMRLPHMQKAVQIHRLVEAIDADPALSESTRKAARAAEKAAKAVEEATQPVAPLERARADARRERDSLAPAWEKARSGLVLAARNADYDGHGDLHAALFGNLPRAPRRKRRNRVDTPTPSEATAAEVV